MSPPRAFDRGGQRVASARGRNMAWGSRRLGLGAEGRPAWEEGGGALPPVSVGTSSPWSGEMLAAQPQAARQDLSQIKGTYGIHSWHEGSPGRTLPGFSPEGPL